MLTKVLYAKDGEAKRFLIVDAAMNDLIRPSLYDAYHDIRPVYEKLTHGEKNTVDVVGPVCESGDFLATDRVMPAMGAGDLMAVMSAGAYGFVMSSNYNSRPRVPEVLVHEGQYHVIRSRESYEDLIRGEEVPEFLS
jgi:diaminopimelate decarboxylase